MEGICGKVRAVLQSGYLSPRVVNYLVGSYVGEFMKSRSSPCKGWVSRYRSESLMCYFLPTDFPENSERKLLKRKDGENNVQ